MATKSRLAECLSAVQLNKMGGFDQSGLAVILDL